MIVVEVTPSGDHCLKLRTLFPGLDDSLSNQPYYVVMSDQWLFGR